MSELILALHTNFHDASAALFEDYELRAAVQLERLTRHKGDGREHPDLAIDEVLAIAGATRRDIDAVALGRMLFPFEYFRNIRGTRWLHWQYRKHVQGNARRHMMAEILRYRGADDAVFDAAKFRRASGLRADTRVFFYNHHESHALRAAVLHAVGRRAAGHGGCRRRHRQLQPSRLRGRQAHDDLWRRGMPVRAAAGRQRRRSLHGDDRGARLHSAAP